MCVTNMICHEKKYFNCVWIIVKEKGGVYVMNYLLLHVAVAINQQGFKNQQTKKEKVP